MSDAERHLSDEEIDLYVVRLLDAARAASVEEHYLDCPACLERVTHVKRLAAGLEGVGRPPARPRLAPLPVAAALLAALSALLALQAWRLRASLSAAQTRAEAAEARARAPDAVRLVTLAPPQRGHEPLRVPRPQAGALVVVRIDARELAAPGARIDVSLVGAGGEVRARLAGIRSATDGFVELPLPADTLGAGGQRVELTAGQDVLRIPFVVVH